MYGFPTTSQSLKGISGKKKQTVEDDGEYFIPNDRKWEWEHSSDPNRGFSKVKVTKKSSAKIYVYNFSSTSQCELITHTERGNILFQRT